MISQVDIIFNIGSCLSINMSICYGRESVLGVIHRVEYIIH